MPSYTESFEEESSMSSLVAGSKRGVRMANFNSNDAAADAAADDDDKRSFPSTPFPKKARMEVAIMTPNLENMSSCDADDEPSPKITDHISPDATKATNSSDSPSPEEEDDDVAEDEEPDWDTLGASDPAGAQVQIDLFLKAREMRDQADDHFSHAMDDCHARLEATKKAILQAVANVHNLHRTELDYLEADIKSTIVWNHKARTEMTAQLEETRNRAQGLFQQLLMNVSSSQASLFGAGIGGVSASNGE